MVLLSLAATADEGRSVTRTLQQSVDVPNGDDVVVQNLVGHMRVVQGSGPLQVDATVIAGGDHAEALAKSVKLSVATVGKQIQVHVYYPVDRYDTYIFSPPGSQAQNDYDDLCILGKYFCFQGKPTFSYQGKRVRVVQSSHRNGVPLYVDVIIHLPAHVTASFENQAGLLEADGLVNDLSMATRGGDIQVENQSGTLNAVSHGGDIRLASMKSSNAQMLTSGGDVTGNRLSGDITIKTDGGDARLDTVSGKLALMSDGGDVAMAGDLASLQSLRALTDGGDFSASGDLTALASVDVNSDGGDIMFRASNLSTHLNATSDGGHIHVDLPDMSSVSKSSHHLSCDINKGTGIWTLRSDGGSITLAKL